MNSKSLQLSRTTSIFGASFSLFLTKWARHTEFCCYFKKQWLDNRSIWYEDYAPSIPSHDNTLESTNLQVKHDTSRDTQLESSLIS